jgi:hypothetical protein
MEATEKRISHEDTKVTKRGCDGRLVVFSSFVTFVSSCEIFLSACPVVSPSLDR